MDLAANMSRIPRVGHCESCSNGFRCSDDTCIQCHSQGQPKTKLIEGKAYDWPVGYHVGVKLQDYWKLEDITLGKTDFLYFADGTAHKNRMQGNDFMQSVMYERGVTCASCHDVHGTRTSLNFASRPTRSAWTATA